MSSLKAGGRRATACTAVLVSSLLVIPFVLGQAGPADGEELVRVRRVHYLMGTLFEITAYGRNRPETAQAIEEAFARIREADEAMSHYRPESDLMRLNRRGGKQAVPVPAALYAVLRESLQYGEVSGGAFDVTVGPLVRLWQEAAERQQLPSAEAIAAVRARVGFAKVKLLPGSRVQFAREGVEVNLGGIGKGWAVDAARDVLRAHGIENALISAGTSTVYALGSVPGGQGWPVALRDPCNREGTFETLSLQDAAVSTSASYERYWEIEGRRFGHIVDPRNGWPVEPLLSASVVAPTAAESDALSTAVYVLGREEGTSLLQRLGREGVLVDEADNGGCVVRRINGREGKASFFSRPGESHEGTPRQE
ncbi:MAG: FAD:protein FMN transferase [Terriglobia bacterium]